MRQATQEQLKAIWNGTSGYTLKNSPPKEIQKLGDQQTNKSQNLASEKSIQLLDNAYSEEYGMTVLSANQKFDINLIKTNETYQRPIEPARKNKIATSMRSSGYWPFEVIIINEKHEVIDGQHRVSAAKVVGIKHVPVCIVNFPSHEKEAMFFTIKNSYNPLLSPIHFWHARYESKHPTAVLMYKLESDSDSLLYNKIAIKGKSTAKTKYPISHFFTLLLPVIGIIEPTWGRGVKIDNRIIRLIGGVTYDFIKNNINGLVLWIESCFGLKNDNPTAYVSHNIRAIVRFYFILVENNINPTSTINKMKSYAITSELTKMSGAGRIYALISHYNHGKKIGRIKYREIND